MMKSHLGVLPRYDKDGGQRDFKGFERREGDVKQDFKAIRIGGLLPYF